MPSILFQNDTDLPIMIDTWIGSSLQSFLIEPRENTVLASCTGEWYINSMLEDRTIWVENKLQNYLNIGKFWFEPSAMGEYSSMDYPNKFICSHTVENNKIKFIFKQI